MLVVPLPLYYEKKEGQLILSNTTFKFSEELANSANFFKSFLKKKTGFALREDNYAQINFVLDFNLEEEEYHLEINEHSLILAARTDAGALYGVQTLKQLLKYKNSQFYFPEIYLEDKPHFSYRGFMLDIARHFFGKKEIFRLIELISFHKFNTLHLHLTDDQGWRFESDKYPKLQEISSQRYGTILKDGSLDNIIHYGYLKKKDLKEIVEYAKTFHIQVIPEIDMPGHMQALLAAYPGLLCEGVNKKIEVGTSWGIAKNILCAGKDKTYQVLEDLLLEIMEVFPSYYIHLGGDEAPKNNWRACPCCQEKIKKENLADEDALQAYFFNHFQDFISKHGRSAIGWNDGLHPDLNEDIIIQHWKPGTRNKTIQAINNGRKVIMSDFFYLYLDYPYAMTPLSKTYHYNPLKKVKNKENVLGVEAPLWTEWVGSRAKIDFQIFPRLAAVAEVAWCSPEEKDYQSFVERLQNIYPIYQALAVNYAENMEKKPNLLSRVYKTKKWWKNEDSEFLKN